MKINTRDVRGIVPSDYKRKTVVAEVVTRFEIVNLPGRDNAGSHDEYRTFSAVTQKPIGLCSPREGACAMMEGVLVVRSTWFCGRTAAVVIYVHPSDVASLMKDKETQQP